MAYSNQSKYSKEEIDRMAGECYELLKRGETTFVEYRRYTEAGQQQRERLLFIQQEVQGKGYS